MVSCYIDGTGSSNKKGQPSQAALHMDLLDIVLPQAGEKRSHPSADFQVINGVPNADYRHLKAVGFALLARFSATQRCSVNLGFGGVIRIRII
ncbi:hypothetical protein EMIT0347P_50154 [Pseudomonas sp. IT-347P]